MYVTHIPLRLCKWNSCISFSSSSSSSSVSLFLDRNVYGCFFVWFQLVSDAQLDISWGKKANQQLIYNKIGWDWVGFAATSISRFAFYFFSFTVLYHFIICINFDKCTDSSISIYKYGAHSEGEWKTMQTQPTHTYLLYLCSLI